MKIGIASGSPQAVDMLCHIVAMAPHGQVAWVAGDGNEAVASCRRALPDLLLMDVDMPLRSGVEATRRIMCHTPCPILLVSACLEDNLAAVFDATGHGALDAVNLPMPGPAQALQAAAVPLLGKIATIGRLTGGGARLATRAQDGAACAPPAAAAPAAPPGRQGGPRLVAIGASAGGPAALVSLLGGLPAEFAAAVVIVQHIDAVFVPALVEWLGRNTRLRVLPATVGQVPQSGCVYIAARDGHLVLDAQGAFDYTSEPAGSAYRPSVDVFFNSVAGHWRGPVVGVLLTGMGRDGAQGLRRLRDARHHTIAQDRQSSTVYGMPKAAAALEAAVDVLPLDRIARRLCDVCAGIT